ncbi:sucrose-6-phosphate hydrolase [Anaerobacillus sp. CMMVII]|uniref:glycoside hydrolase family 32 protein n=1 Tax=Anaerobacillus sp. CMMVII TaxID=2755588 RepID=UPI0021B8133E|nr:sucrose-6-phosphate hydrolase [Anaerobacillus sp. CMMVII]MCT8137618.1 sucrose-6-phosphate hydrolase [Anaerobacillus sp. CMMVII]
MSTKDRELRERAYESVEKYKETVNKDPYRLHYHIMPPVGLLNDPNGFIHWNGRYHLFYQWMPFKTGHGAKFWGHVSTEDFINWREEEIALTPSEWYEKNGCYSGSAIEHDGKMYIFYTGNVKDENGNRETYQCLGISEDGVNVEKKGPVVELPEGYTPHFRDPKVWKQDDQFYMVVGAQTLDKKGAVALFSSDNLTAWSYEGDLAGGGKGPLKDFGYMFECPDLFSLGEKDMLIISPQGLKPDGMKYRNVYQSGYVVGYFDPKGKSYDHGEFEELDRGFDFYAPQTTEDSKGRRLMFAWMSVPDQNEQDHPTVEYQWLHNMTLPRELKMVGDKLYQLPVEELEGLRIGEALSHRVTLRNEVRELEGVNGRAVELRVNDISLVEGWFEIAIHDAARIVYSNGVFTLERKSYVDGTVENRQCILEKLDSLTIYIDTSSVEVFVNGGEEVFTARYYPAASQRSITFGASKECSFSVEKWDLGKRGDGSAAS